MLVSPDEGRGECRVLDAPAVSRAKWVESTRGRHRGFTGLTRHSRTRWFYGFLRDLPGDRAWLSPSPAVCLRKLDASVEASGPHDFAVRIRRCSSAAPSASIASRPASVTIAIRPFGGTRRRGLLW